MHLFIEEAFLIDFEIDYNIEQSSIGQNCLHKIFTEYTGLRLYFDNLSILKDLNSKYFNFLTDYNPNILEIGNFDSYFEDKNELPNQTIILSTEVLKNQSKIEILGGLCLDYLNYQSKIKTIIEKLHFKFSFSEDITYFSWDKLEVLSIIPIKTIVIDDPYVLLNEKNQLLKDNLIPMLKCILKHQNNKTSLTIFSDKINNSNEKSINEIDCVKKRYQLLENELNEKISSICIAKSKKYRQEYDQHDRYLYTPFTIIGIGKGFNLFPFSKNNSKIEVSTIFEKYYYNEMKNHYKNLNNIYQKLEKVEYISSHLKIYPDSLNLKLHID